MNVELVVCIRNCLKQKRKTFFIVTHHLLFKMIFFSKFRSFASEKLPLQFFDGNQKVSKDPNRFSRFKGQENLFSLSTDIKN